MDPLTIVAALAAGAAIGIVLSLVGGGGSILAVPLLVYLVGVDSAHAAIGTGAVAVALNAATGLAGHARAGNVKWPCALVFAGAGLAGALIGAEAGKAIDGALLLALFGALMIAVGAMLLRKRTGRENPAVRLTRASAGHLLPRLVPAGLAVGLLAGFFGIGGGFLIVPALMAATGMPIGIAIGTSLVAVTALGAGTAASYALSGYVDWTLVGLMTLGGIAGAIPGQWASRRLSERKRLLNMGFAALVIATGAYIVAESMARLG